MSKYDVGVNTQTIDIQSILTEGEKVIWSGKPKKSAFIINKALVMFPFAIIWLLFDSIFIIAMFSAELPDEMLKFVILFLAIHLMPVWIWLGNVLTAKKRWENTEYVVTDKRIITKSGFIGMDYKSVYYKDIKEVQLKVGVIDKLLKVGDIYFGINVSAVPPFLDIENAYELYPKLQKVVLDIQTDIEYPNELRPETNRGYDTEYKSNL